MIDTINQAGLADNYVDGVTCFDDYVNNVGFNSNHSETVGEFVQTVKDNPSTDLVVTYEFASPVSLDAVAWCQEDDHDSPGNVETIKIETSPDNAAYTEAVEFDPAQPVANLPYGPEVTGVKYVRVTCDINGFESPRKRTGPLADVVVLVQ